MADIARLGFSVDTSGLVRAERDLDKLGTAGKRTEKSLDGVGSASSSASGQLKGVSSSAGIAGVSFGKLGGAIAGAVAVFGSLSFLSDATSQMIEQSRQLIVLSNAYNVSTDSIQAWQSAAKPLGIEADKIGDIFKDVSDKIGDFATTGGGEAKDMFEQLGLSIKEFKSLAPDKAILKIGEALDKSKLTKSQKIFLLEGLADDASLLLPLLEDNAAALKKVSDNAAIRASFMSEADIRTMQAASGELKNIQLAASGIAKQAGLAGAAFLAAFGSDITSGIGAVSSGLSSISTEWAFFIDDLRYGDGIFAGLRESFDGFKMGLNGISEALFPAYDAVSRFVSTTDLLTPILPFIEEAVGSASLAFQTFARGVVFAVDTIEELGIVQMIGGWFSSASDALSPFSDTLSTIGLYIADFAGAFATAAGILGVGSAVFSVIAGGLGIVGSAFTALGAVMIANPVGLTIAAIAGAAYLIYNNWGAVSGFFTGLWSSVTASTTSAMQSISDAIANNQFMQEAGALFGEINATFSPALSAFVDMHIAAWSAVGGAASEAMTALGGYISTGWDSAVAVFLQYEPALIEAASSIWSGIQSITSAAWQSLIALIGMAWDGIRGLLTAGLRLLRGDFEGAWAAIVETAHNLGDGLMQYFSGLPALMIDYGKNIVMGLANGMASAAGAAVESARAMAREVASSITGFFDMHSPSRLTHEYGYNIGSGLALGVDASTGLAVQSATAMAQSVGSTLGSGLESAGKSGQQFYVNQEKVNEALKDGDEKAKKAAASIKELSAPWLSGSVAFKSEIEAAASRFGVDANLVKAVIQQETGFLKDAQKQLKAVSPAGAKGIMQVMPGTAAMVAKEIGLTNYSLFKAADNITLGTAYLSQQLAKYNGDISKVAAAYNAGPGAVDKYAGIPPYKETQGYVKNVLGYYAELTKGVDNSGKAQTQSILEVEKTRLDAAKKIADEKAQLQAEVEKAKTSTLGGYAIDLRVQGVGADDRTEMVALKSAAALAQLQRQAQAARMEAVLSKDAFREWQLVNQEGFTPSVAAAQAALEQQSEKFKLARDIGNDFAEIMNNEVSNSLKDIAHTGNRYVDLLIDKLIEASLEALNLQKSLNFSTSGSGGGGGLGSIFSGIGNWIGGLFGGGRANGGTVYSSKIHPINERGVPEVVTTSSGQYLMNTDGRVSPLTAVTPTAGGGGSNISVVLNAPLTIDARGADDNSLVQLQGQLQAFQQRIYRDVPALVRQAQINARRSPSV